MKHALGRIAVALAALVCAGFASGQAFPSKPIRFVIGYPPGTIIDAVGRIIGNEMSKQLGQPVVLEFKPGANGTIGAKYVVGADPDGHTLYFGTASAIHPLLNRNNAVDAGKDLASVSWLASAPFFMWARADLPINSLQDFAAYTKAKPDSLTYGAPTATAHMMMSVFKERTGIVARGISYKGSPQVSMALLSSEVDLSVVTALSFLPHVQTGKIRALMVLAPKRSPLLPNVPTSSEFGIRNFEFATNMGLWAPLGTPKEVIARLNAEAVAAVKNPAIAEQIRKAGGAEPIGSTPEGQIAIHESDTRAWTEAARLGNFQPE